MGMFINFTTLVGCSKHCNNAQHQMNVTSQVQVALHWREVLSGSIVRSEGEPMLPWRLSSSSIGQYLVQTTSNSVNIFHRSIVSSDRCLGGTVASQPAFRDPSHPVERYARLGHPDPRHLGPLGVVMDPIRPRSHLDQAP